MDRHMVKLKHMKKPGLPSLIRPILLIDYDGTMTQTRPAITQALQEALQDCGCHTLNQAAVARFLAGGGTFFDFFHAHVPQATAAEDQKFITAYHQHYLLLNRTETHLFPGVKDTLQQLHAQGYCLVSVSNKWEVALRDCLAQFEVLAYFTGVVGSEIGKPRKPQGAVWSQRIAPLLARKGLHVAPQDCVAVGDTAADIDFAHNAHTLSCWAKYGFGDPAQCAALHPQFEIEDFPALLPLAQSLTKNQYLTQKLSS